MKNIGQDLHLQQQNNNNI